MLTLLLTSCLLQNANTKFKNKKMISIHSGLTQSLTTKLRYNCQRLTFRSCVATCQDVGFKMLITFGA